MAKKEIEKMVKNDKMVKHSKKNEENKCEMVKNDQNGQIQQKQLKIIERFGKKLSKMVKKQSKWQKNSKIVKNGQKWLNIAKMSKIVKYCQKLSKMV